MTDIHFSHYMTSDQAAPELGLATQSVRTMVSKRVIEGRKSPIGGVMVLRTFMRDYFSIRKNTGRLPKS